MRNLQRTSITDRLQRTTYLLKNSLTVVGRDRDIITPWIRSTIYGCVEVTPFYLGVGFIMYGIAAQSGGLIGWGVGALALWLGLFLYKSFFYNHQEMRQSWLVAETAAGRDRSYADAKERAQQVESQIRAIAALDMLAAWIANRQANKDEDSGLGAFVVNLFIAGLTEVWDLLNHFLIPAVAIDGVTIKDGISNVRRLKDQVPETLTGVFGIDFLARVVGVIVAPVYFVLTLVALSLSIAMADMLPAFSLPMPSGVEVPAALLTDGALKLTVIPLFALIFVGKLFSVVLERAVISVKIIYFTIFYVQITHPDRIASDLQPELEAYLKMESLPQSGAAVETA